MNTEIEANKPQSDSTTSLKRYLLFCFDPADAQGGWGDFFDSFHAQIEAEEAGKADVTEYWQVVDTHTGRTVSSGNGRKCSGLTS